MALLWTPSTEELCATVVDLRSNQSFQLPVGARTAMQVFHHPYPYAAECGLLGADPETECAPEDLSRLRAEEPAP